MNRRDFLKSVMVGAAGVSVPLGVTAHEPVRYVESAPIVVDSDGFVPTFPRKVLKIFTENGLETFPAEGNTVTLPKRIVEAIYTGTRHWIEEIVITDSDPKITIG